MRLFCQRCGKEVEAVLTPSGVHMKGSCGECGRYIKFVSQGGPVKLYFGKYRDETIDEIAKKDRGYLEWLVRQEFTKPKIRESILEVLNGRRDNSAAIVG